MKTRILSLLLAVCLLLPLAGCSSAPVLMRYGDSSVTVNMYRYWLSTYKGTFMNTYSDMSDTDAFWNSILYDDVTAEQYLNDAVIENVKRTLVCMELFDQYGLKLSKDTTETIDAYIDDMISERANGSKNVFNQTLAAFGINTNMLREIYLCEEKTSQLFSYLYQSGGPRALSSEALETYCRENYVRVRHIYVNDAYAYETDENGYTKYSTSGLPVTRALNAEEAAAAAEKIAAIEQALADGQSFDTVYETYSEDHYYKNGYYLTRTTDFIYEVVDAAFSLEVGETVCVKSDYGTHFLMRLEMDAAPYKNSENADFFDSFDSDAKNADFRQYLDTLLPDVEVDTEELARYSIRDAAVNYSI